MKMFSNSESNSDSEYTGSIKPYMFEPVESNVDNATAVKTPPKVGQASQVVSEWLAVFLSSDVRDAFATDVKFAS